MPHWQMPKRKRRVAFPCRKQEFFRTSKIATKSAKVDYLECLFQSRCPGPAALQLACGCFGLGSPGRLSVRTHRLEKQAGTLKENSCLEKEDSDEVEEACSLTPLALISGPFQVDQLTYLFQSLFPPPLFGTHLDAQD